MRRKAVGPVEVYFLTDPLCPWSWAMEPLIGSLRHRDDLAFRSIMAAWLPSLAVKPVDAAKREWAEAAAKTGAKIDPAFWDRVAPKTSLVAAAAVKSVEYQGTAKMESYLTSVRRSVFEQDGDPTSFDGLVSLANSSGVNPELLRVDLGVGRYSVDDVVAALDPKQPLSESVWWFGRRRMLRSWGALAEDFRNAERQGLSPPAFHVLRGKEQAAVRGFAAEADLQRAIASVT